MALNTLKCNHLTPLGLKRLNKLELYVMAQEQQICWKLKLGMQLQFNMNTIVMDFWKIDSKKIKFKIKVCITQHLLWYWLATHHGWYGSFCHLISLWYGSQSATNTAAELEISMINEIKDKACSRHARVEIQSSFMAFNIQFLNL